MGVTFVGVRHHSPACARLVARTVEALRPAYVLVEGPSDVNGRLDELLLGHELPVAVFTSYRDAGRQHASWAPFCDYSPEWVALTTGRRVGAEVRFIDLPAWHPAFAERSNRYADAELRYADVVGRLCRSVGVDDADALWDHLFEIAPDEGLAERLAAYFDLVRGESAAGDDDVARERYMAAWVRAALAHAGDRPVVVVTGGFHRPALIRLAGEAGGAGGAAAGAGWPPVPAPAGTAVGSSYLVPYSFRRLDAFDGYQSGMPSPDYYQRVWDRGADRAATDLMRAVVERLRRRGQPVSTADLVAARTGAQGLAAVRGHRHPARVDVLDGLAGALVNEALDTPLPWTVRGTLAPGSHPVLVEMVAAASGRRVGRLHPSTPVPPLVHHVTADLARYGLDGSGEPRLDLTRDDDRDRSRLLHRLRVLAVPGVTRESGPDTGVDPELTETWTLRESDDRLPALIEAGGYGPTPYEAAVAVLSGRVAAAAGDLDRLAGALFDAASCGIVEVSDRVLGDLRRGVAAAPHLDQLGRLLGVVLALWRHDRLLGTARSATLGAVVAAAVERVLWLAEGVRGGAAPADLPRITALVATRDALVHAGAALDLDRDAALAVMHRLAADRDVPADLRGAAYGFGWSLGDPGADPVRTVRGGFLPVAAGDFLAGLFALAREEVLATDGVLDVLDDLVGALDDHDFMIALPALRQAFAFFPPRERETVAGRLLARRGIAGSGRTLLRTTAAPDLVARGLALDQRVDAALTREGLIAG